MILQDNDYRFQFTIQDVENDADEKIDQKIVSIHTLITYKDGRCLFDGLLRARCNKFGIYPFPADIAKAAASPSLRQALTFQLKRFIRPAKPFL